MPLALSGLKVILLTYLDKVFVWLRIMPLTLSGLKVILTYLDKVSVWLRTCASDSVQSQSYINLP
jgi:hypothetical protein